MDGSRMINEAKSGRGIAHLFVICIAASFANLKYCPYHTRQDIRQWPRLNSDHDFLWWLYPSHPPPRPHQLWLFDNSSPFCTPVIRNPLSSSLGIFSICLIGTYGNDRRPLVAKVDQLVAPEPVCRTISTTCILCVNTNMFVALLIREGVKNGKILDLLLNLHALHNCIISAWGGLIIKIGCTIYKILSQYKFVSKMLLSENGGNIRFSVPYILQQLCNWPQFGIDLYLSLLLVYIIQIDQMNRTTRTFCKEHWHNPDR